MKNINRFLLGEDESTLEEVDFNEEDKQFFLERVHELSRLSDEIRRSGDLKSAITNVKEIVNMAQDFIKQDTADWFDDVTVKRHNKYLADAEKAFNKAATDNVQTQMRLEAAFEDILDILRKYYDLG